MIESEHRLVISENPFIRREVLDHVIVDDDEIVWAIFHLVQGLPSILKLTTKKIIVQEFRYIIRNELDNLGANDHSVFLS